VAQTLFLNFLPPVLFFLSNLKNKHINFHYFQKFDFFLFILREKFAFFVCIYLLFEPKTTQ